MDNRRNSDKLKAQEFILTVLYEDSTINLKRYQCSLFIAGNYIIAEETAFRFTLQAFSFPEVVTQ